MKQTLDQATLDKLLAAALTKKYIYGAVFYVSSGDQSVELISATGDMNTDDRYFIASINKLFVSAIILKMHSENKLHLDDPIARFLPEDIIDGLHRYKGKDYSKEITIKRLAVRCLYFVSFAIQTANNLVVILVF